MNDTVSFDAFPRHLDINQEAIYQQTPAQPKTGRLAAFCLSNKCVKKAKLRKNVFYIYGVEYGDMKDVNIKETDCPDCGYALYWSRRWSRREGQ
jgi:hypothetical protein